MKINVNSNELLNALKKCSKFTDKKLSILDGFLCEIEGDYLKITASDLYMFYATKVSCSVNEGSEGDQFHLSSFVLGVLGSLPTQPIIIEVQTTGSGKEQEITTEITHTSGKIKLLSEDPAEFPKAPQAPKEAESIILEGKYFPIIGKAAKFCSEDELRPAITGVYFAVTAGALQICATDAHKLYKHEGAAEGSDCAFIFPRIVADFLGKLKAQNCALITLGGSYIFMNLGGSDVLSFRPIDARYPDYNAVIPSSTKHSSKIAINKNELLKTAQRVCMTASEKSIYLDIVTEGIELHSENIDYNMSSRESLVCKVTEIEGNTKKTGFNAGYLEVILKAMEAEDIIINFTKNGRPVIFEGDEKTTFLIMPLFVKEEEEEPEAPKKQEAQPVPQQDPQPQPEAPQAEQEAPAQEPQPQTEAQPETPQQEAQPEAPEAQPVPQAQEEKTILHPDFFDLLQAVRKKKANKRTDVEKAYIELYGEVCNEIRGEEKAPEAPEAPVQIEEEEQEESVLNADDYDL